MATKRYLIPIDNDARKRGSDGVRPKYLDLLTSGTAQGLIPFETTTDPENREWLRNFYVVRVDTEDDQVFANLESKPDVILLDENTDLETLRGIGVDIPAGRDSQAETEKAIVSWLTGEERPFSEVV